MDNLSSHCCYKFCEIVAEFSGVECPTEIELKTQIERVEWLRSDSKQIIIHFTPYHGSWLNWVECIITTEDYIDHYSRGGWANTEKESRKGNGQFYFNRERI